ncbi:MAG: hypothetical protein J6O23_00585 [Prevotella sp.]|nr:hypothetical protein [Prevotella sp.]
MKRDIQKCGGQVTKSYYVQHENSDGQNFHADGQNFAGEAHDGAADGQDVRKRLRGN